jgi:beta-N-acetylhexosaminidase
MDAQRGIARRMVVGLPPEGLTPSWEKDFSGYPTAGVIVFRRDFRDLDDLRRLTRRLRELARPRRLFIGIDEEGGFVSQLAGHWVVPPNAQLLARGAQPGDLEYVARVTGQRLRALGVDWVFAPVADIHSRPDNPVIGPRAFGSDPDTVIRNTGQMLAGFAAANIGSCLKHFPGHGDTLLDSHLALPVCDADRATLERREWAPFAAHRDADAVMSTHVVFPAIDAERPATFSRPIVQGVLRDTLRFEGVCITDALEMKGAAEGREPSESGRLALNAGCDLLLYAFHDERLRRVRLDLAKVLVGGALDHSGFDAARPRLEQFAARRPEPTEEELATPLQALTPSDWMARLTAIVERGLEVRGTVPSGASGAWTVCEPEYPEPMAGPPLGELLAQGGVRITGDASKATAHVEAVMTRVPLAAAEIERLERECRARPTVLVALQSDAFLDRVPSAAARVSACDATPLTRSVVARRLAELAAVKASARR